MQKEVYVFLAILVAIVIITASVSAGIFDWLKKPKITGEATSATTALNITVGNTAPTINNVSAIAATDPTIGTTKAITFNFTATDTDGAGNINTSTAQASFNKTGETTRSNSSCINTTAGVDNNINFTCTIDMWYYDLNGAWSINATVKDNSASMAENSTNTFTYNLLTAMVMSPTSLTWTTLAVTDTNVGSDNDPILVNNSGNDVDLNINATSFNLRGETTTTEFIYAANFTIENASQGCSGTAMVNATSINVTSSILQRGNNSQNYYNATSGQEQVYICLKGLPGGISQQSYSSSAYGAWTIAVIT